MQENQLSRYCTELLQYYHNRNLPNPTRFLPDTVPPPPNQSASEDSGTNKAETGRKMASRLGTPLYDGWDILGKIKPPE